MSAVLDCRIARFCTMLPPSSEPPRILCVDDDTDLQVTFELRMQPYEVQVEHAFYGMQGISEALSTRPDLIIADLAMPNGNGEYLLDCVKSNSFTAHIPVIILTGMRDPSLKPRLIHAGASVFLHKPVPFDELLHHISRFVIVRERTEEETLR